MNENPTPPNETSLELMEGIERAQINMQISTAKQYPRTLSKVKADMLSFATLDEETASSCFYTLPRGGKTIQGPSVRLAEIAVSSYGNLRAGSRIVSVVTSGDNPHVVVQSVAHDLEKNVAISIEKRRNITAKKDWKTGERMPISADDINLAANACSAIAFRDAVYKVVPLALIKPVMEAAKKVAIGDASSLAVKRTKIIDRLKQMGAKEDRILAVVNCKKIEDVGMEQLETLIGLGTAIKEGEVMVEQAFPASVEIPKPTFLPETPEAPVPVDIKQEPAKRPGRPRKQTIQPPSDPEPKNDESTVREDDVPFEATTPEKPVRQPASNDTPERALLEQSMQAAGISFEMLQAWMVKNAFSLNCELFTGLDDMADGTVKRVVNKWAQIRSEIEAA